MDPKKLHIYAPCTQIFNYFNCRSSGLIVGGLDRGFISVYDASKIINGNGENALVFSKDKHTGQVCLPIYSPPFRVS